MQPVVIVVNGKKACHVVVVDEGDEVFFPGEVCRLLIDHAIDFRKVGV